jgi:hypothetical protein
MLTTLKVLLVGSLVLFLAAAAWPPNPPPAGLEYTSDGQLVFPEGYRQWVYLTTGFDMSYNPALRAAADHHMFDNVFVNPEAYQSFVRTGTWPDKTMLVLEIRGAEGKGPGGARQGRSALSRQVGVLRLRRSKDRQDGPLVRRLL